MNNFSTPIIQYLIQHGVEYKILPHSTPAISIEDAANQRGIATGLMLKTVLLRDMGGLLFLACVPGDQQVDPKKVRAFYQCRRTTCVDFDKVIDITGYKPGTLTPLDLPESIRVIFDNSITHKNVITISSGSDMAGLLVSTKDIITLCKPTTFDIIRYK